MLKDRRELRKSLVIENTRRENTLDSRTSEEGGKNFDF